MLKRIRLIGINLFFEICWLYEIWWHQCTFLSVSIYFMVIVSQSCLCIRRVRLHLNQLSSAVAFLLDYNSENNFTQAVSIMGMISVGRNYISPIKCSTRKVIILCIALTREILYITFCYAVSHTCHNDVSQGTPKTTVHLWCSKPMYFKKPRPKWLPCPSTNSTIRIPFYLSFWYDFKAYKYLSTFMIICPDIPPPSENSTRKGTFTPS